MSNTWVELNLGILGENIRALRRALSPRTEIVFVVKSNAYGHGMLPVAGHAWKCGVRWFAVAHVDEALALRRTLPAARIVIVGAIDPADVGPAARRKLIPVIVDEKHARAVASAASRARVRLCCHVKVDTGMGRLGFVWDAAARVLPKLVSLPGLEITGICSHFASADPRKRSFADTQARRFFEVAKACETAGMKKSFRHISNTGAILCNAAWALDGVRPGILLYGYGGAGGRCIRTQPFLQWKTRVVQVKKVPAGFPVSYGSAHVTKRATTIATIDAGYADGYHRALSNKGIVLIGGRRCPVVGRVTMNLTMVDVGPASTVKARDEAVLIGAQGRASIWADELARLAGTIPYEILTSIRSGQKAASRERIVVA